MAPFDPPAWRPAHHRFFVAAPLLPGTTRQVDALAHQLAVVLRLNAGDPLYLFNGDGREYLATLQHLTPRQATVAVLAARPALADPAFELTLFQCSLKQDKFDWVLQKGTELGVTRFCPVVSARSIVRPAAALQTKQSRWETIVREATEQCGRTQPPPIAPAVDWPPPPLPPGTAAFVAWEEAGPATPRLGDAVAARLPSPAPVALLVGPEGGLLTREIEELLQAGWQPVSLGRRILRAETAAVAGLALMAERLDSQQRSAKGCMENAPV